jgi:hypothetical protein
MLKNGSDSRLQKRLDVEFTPHPGVISQRQANRELFILAQDGQ